MSASVPDCANCQRVVSRDAEIDRLQGRVGELTTQLEEARRAAKRQAAPFSKGAPKASPKKPGRKAGSAYGPRASRDVPRHVDETLEAPLPGRCPHCAGAHLVDERVADQFQTDIPPIRPITRRFRVHVGRCLDCGRRVQGRHELQTSDALGAAAVQIGPTALALAAQMNKELGVPYGKVTVFFQTAFLLPLARSTPCRANERLAAKAAPTYQAMVVAVRGAMVLYSDETGWKIAGRLAWLWAFVTIDITLYVIRRSRGFDVVEETIGARFGGLFGRDGWAPYRLLEARAHQSCVGHLLRRAKDLHELSYAGQARFPLAVKETLSSALALRDRRRQMSAHGFAVARGRLEARMDRILDGHITYAPNARFKRHLRKERDALFTFLHHPEIEATTWMAEQEIRPGVVNRKTSGGSRSDRGADAQAILPSVIRTARRQGREPVGLMVKLLRARDPIDLGLARGRQGRSRTVQLPGAQARASPAA